MEWLSSYIMLHYKLPPMLSGLKQQILLSSSIYSFSRSQQGLLTSAPLSISWDSSPGDSRVHFQDGTLMGLAKWFFLLTGGTARVVG